MGIPSLGWGAQGVCGVALQGRCHLFPMETRWGGESTYLSALTKSTHQASLSPLHAGGNILGQPRSSGGMEGLTEADAGPGIVQDPETSIPTHL